MRVLVFGASTTQGYWDTEGGWVARIRRRYDENSVKTQAAGRNEREPSVFNLGVSADTSADILKRFDAETLARKSSNHDLAFVFSVGGNDSSIEGGAARSTPDQYGANMLGLIESARKHSDKIMCVSLPPCDEKRTTPVFWRNVHFTNERFKLFNSVLEKVCQEQKIKFVPVFEPLKKRFDAGEDLFVDGLHPNNAGHQIMADLILPHLDKLLKG